MRPPMQSAVLQQNEGYHQAHLHSHTAAPTAQSARPAHQQQQQSLHRNHSLKDESSVRQQQQQLTHQSAKLQPLELLVEHKLSYSCAVAAAAAAAYQPANRNDSRQLLDLTHSSVQADGGANGAVDQRTSPSPPTKRSSDSSQFSGCSSNSDGESQTDTSACIFDDAAENFIINFPADSSAQSSLLLPLSETVPLLTHIEATVADKQRAIRVSKNSHSLIFTKKELNPNPGIHHNLGSIQSHVGQQSKLRQQPYNNLYGIDERPRKTTKHLPSTRNLNQQQHHLLQRRSLPLTHSSNYNNLLSSASCGAAATTEPNTGSGHNPGSGIGNNLSCSSYNSSKVVLPKHHVSGPALVTPTSAGGSATRKQLSYSWYAPVYSALEEELEQDSRDSSPIHNLANTKQQQQHSAATVAAAQRLQQQQRASYSVSHAAEPTDSNETVALLETTRNKFNIAAEIVRSPLHRDYDAGAGAGERKALTQAPRNSLPHSLSLSLSTGGGGNGNGNGYGNDNGNGNGNGSGSAGGAAPATIGSVHEMESSSLGLGAGPLPRRRRIENFLKSLVGLKSSSNSSAGSSAASTPGFGAGSVQRPISPEIRITRTPSEQDIDAVLRDPAGRHLGNGDMNSCNGSIKGSTSSLNVVHQKLWHLIRREGSGSATNLQQEKSQSIVQYKGMRKCETVLALTRQSHSMPGPNPDFLTTATSTGSGIYSANGVEQIRPLNRLRNSINNINTATMATSAAGATCSRCSSILSLAASGSRYSLANGFIYSTAPVAPPAARPESAQSLNAPRRPSVSFSTIVDVIDDASVAAGLPLEENEQKPHINVNAQIRLSGEGGGCGGGDGTIGNIVGSHKSSVSSQSVNSPSPPSNVTTATLHSNNVTAIEPHENGLQASSHTPTGTPTLTPTQIELGAFGTTHAYPLTVSSLLSMATANQAARACCVRDGITLKQREMVASTDVTPSAETPDSPKFQPFTCKLCLIEVESQEESTTLLRCGCQFCTECMRAYVEFEISEGAYEISCPDAKCPTQGAITLPEIASLTTTNLLKKHHRYRLNREIELDKTRTWCPRAGCETICVVGSGISCNDGGTAGTGVNSAICQIDESPSTSATSQSYTPQVDAAGLSIAVQCPSCKDEFCALCKKAYHPNINCEEYGRRLIADGQDDIGIPFDNELIKCCPMCAVPIEKDEGCAQMMCKRCKHVFCWYCLASLDDDFLLRHYDKGPCKNKLGHSRASVLWHRSQVIGIFAGFGILLLVASPLLLLAAPCIICCKCRGCSGSKIDEVDGELEEEVTALQG